MLRDIYRKAHDNEVKDDFSASQGSLSTQSWWDDVNHQAGDISEFSFWAE